MSQDKPSFPIKPSFCITKPTHFRKYEGEKMTYFVELLCTNEEENKNPLPNSIMAELGLSAPQITRSTEAKRKSGISHSNSLLSF